MVHRTLLGTYNPCHCPTVHDSFATKDKKGEAHPLILNEAVARVFRRLADRWQGVVTNMSMMTIRPEFSAHFLEIYIKKTEGAKFTGYMQLDRVRTICSSTESGLCIRLC